MPPGAAAGPTILSEDVRARVELIEVDGRAIVRKTYRSPALLLWRTLFRRSRAAREFANLRALAAAGLPCILVVACREDRRCGLLLASTLETEFLAGTTTLHWSICHQRDGRLRAALARSFGELLRALHAHGLCSTTASPRNFLVRDGTAELVIIDQPHLARLGRGAFLRRAGQGDLYDAFFSPRRLQEWSRTERWRGLLAYCGGEQGAARAAWSHLARRRRWSLRLDRNLARILGHLRRTTQE